MPNFELLMSCETENIKEVKREENTPFIIQFKCGKCGELTSDIQLDPQNQEDIPGSRGKTNQNYRCKMCKYASTIDVKSETPQDCSISSTQCVAILEIRGSLLPNNWKYSHIHVVSQWESEFTTDQDEFVEWDEVGNQNISILNIKYETK